MIVIKGYKPLVFANKETIIISKRNNIYRYIIASNKIELLCSLPLPFKQKMFYLNKLVYRIVRGGIRNAVLNGNDFYCSYLGRIWRIQLDVTKALLPEPIFLFPKGNSPLNFTVIDTDFSDECDFKTGVYFGEYFSNPDMKAVNIYLILQPRSIVRLVYTFPEGSINHIHAIVPDKKRKCVWILAGDFGNGASIWKAENDFKKVTCIVKGNQKYRSCVAFPIDNGLLYATDSQLERNEIRLLNVDDPRPESKVLFGINGPAIYGTMLEGNYVFTTATEALSGPRTSWKDIINVKPGTGIIQNQSDIILVTPFLKMYKLYSNPKDIWPYYLCQFGNILVPGGINKSQYLVTYNIANKVNNMSTEIRTYSEIQELISKLS